jgi:uncharacterized MAPEG superfamily protein
MSELHWLAATSLLTATMWMLYVPNRMAVLGLARTLGNPAPDDPPLAPWAQRAAAAHRNAVENLVVFAALILAAHALETPCALTQAAAAIYFFARLAHFVVYLVGIPVLRTLAFAAGWACQVVVALCVLGAL